MEWLSGLLNSQPFIAVFLAVGLGYAVGNIKIAGFSLGVGAVLFVGLLIGVIAPKSAPPGFVGVLGLVLFMYGKKQQRWPQLAGGLLLMVYPYFATSVAALVSAGMCIGLAVWLAIRLGW